MQKKMVRKPEIYSAMEPGSDPNDYNGMIDVVMKDTLEQDPRYAINGAYDRAPALPANPRFQSPQSYYDRPFNIGQNPQIDTGGVPSRSPYQIDKGIAKPFGLSPIEKAQMEAAIQAALGKAATQGAAVGNTIPFRR